MLTVNWVYTLPFFKEGHGILHSTLGGWELTGIMSRPIRGSRTR